ncbi:bacteriocin-like protein [Flavobacterium kingsejongi]|uniref:Bacteriocin n=1 Tax=Flavobacterium kingsejongi TaxID=1678728 RepID=A0A2S1LR31_9FLAO|nr:bacteriocin [Flavobacterium kingsejongi]AWG26230.1 hypothetical protein FK004_13825 [Flavobacterium kingsejongi]
MENFKKLDRNELKSISGGIVTWCRRRSDNVIDIRGGGPNELAPPTPYFINENGCYVYPGMPWDAHPNNPPNQLSPYLAQL